MIPNNTSPRPRHWRKLLATYGFSALLHGTLLGLCSLIVLRQTTIEQIFAQLVVVDPIEYEPLDDVTTIQTIDPEIDATNNSPLENIVDQLPDVRASGTMDINDLDPELALESFDVPGLANIKLSDQTSGRSDAARAALVKRYGGNTASEAAVATGLHWLANHQLDDGGWSFDHNQCRGCKGQCSQPGSMPECRTGATGLALLAFLGGGHTHKKGNYTKQVRQGFDALLRYGKLTSEGLDLTMTSDLAAGNKHAAFYAQGIATIALCEVVGMTHDSRYRTAANNAVKFIIASQDAKGGWRYAPRTPGDTSVVGWQVMALKSAQNAKLKFPSVTFKRAEEFLDSVASEGGSRYGYLDSTNPGATTTAVGLLCRMYLGWDRKQTGLQDGVLFLDQTRPSPNNMYFNYYATQVIHHWGGDEWTRWNAVMRDALVTTQHGAERGHSAGSWDIADPHGGAGGRLFMTALGVMTLEVYYRHLPIYQREQIKVEF